MSARAQAAVLAVAVLALGGFGAVLAARARKPSRAAWRAEADAYLRTHSAELADAGLAFVDVLERGGNMAEQQAAALRLGEALERFTPEQKNEILSWIHKKAVQHAR